ncbi:Nuclear distribution protein NudE, partial [Phytophthora palmivora]
REKSLEVALQLKEKQCEYWESEFHRVDREVSVQKAAERELNQELQTKADDVRVWKVKVQGVMISVDELRLQNSNLRKKEHKLVATLRQQVEAAESSQQLKTRVAKRELKIESLWKQCQDRQDELEQVEPKTRGFAQRNGAEFDYCCGESTGEREAFRKEIFRLREEVLLSESQWETEYRQQQQLIEGK